MLKLELCIVHLLVKKEWLGVGDGDGGEEAPVFCECKKLTSHVSL